MLVSSHLMSELQDTADHLVVVGRGQVIADTSVAELIAAASGDRVALRTAARPEAMTVLAHAGATVAATGRDTLTVSGLPAERVVAAARRERGAVLRGVRAPRHAGGGLHGAHPRRGRVPRRARLPGGGAMTGTITPYRSGQRPGATASRSCCARSGPSSAPCAAG